MLETQTDVINLNLQNFFAENKEKVIVSCLGAVLDENYTKVGLLNLFLF